MAAAAVASSGPVTVLAALESTLGPTLDLLAQEAARADVAPRVRTRLVAGAWERFEAGDLAGYHDLVARSVEAAEAEGAAVVVLAQASMAPAADLARCGVARGRGTAGFRPERCRPRPSASRRATPSDGPRRLGPRSA